MPMKRPCVPTARPVRCATSGGDALSGSRTCFRACFASLRALGGRLLAAGIVLVHAAAVLGSLAAPIWVLLRAATADSGRSLIADADRWPALLGNTAQVTLVATVASLAVGTGLAVVLFRTNARGRTAIIALLLLAATIPLQVMSAAVFATAGIERWRGSLPAVGLLHALAGVPLITLIVGLSLRSVSADLEEAAILEGASVPRVLRHVTLPAAASGLLACVLLLVLWTATDYSVSDVLLVRTFAEEVYTRFQLEPQRPYASATTGLPLLVLLAALLATLGPRALREPPEVPSTAPLHSFHMGRWRSALSVAAAVVGFAVAIGPVLALIPRLRGGRSLIAYARFFWPELATTLGTSLCAGLTCALLAPGLAWWFLSRPRWRTPLAGYVIVALSVPAPVLAISLIHAFNHDDWRGRIYDSPAMIVLAHTVRFLPVALLLLVPAVRAVPADCVRAARVDGCGSLGVFRHIVWPSALPTTLVALFVVLTLSLGELPCSQLVAPPGYQTVIVRFFTLIHYGLYPDAAALCLISMATILFPWTGLLFALRKRLLA